MNAHPEWNDCSSAITGGTATRPSPKQLRTANAWVNLLGRNQSGLHLLTNQSRSAIHTCLFYWCFASFSLGIAIEQISLGILVLATAALAIQQSESTSSAFEGRRVALIFLLTIIVSAVAFQIRTNFASTTNFYWGFVVFWCLSIPFVHRINWVMLHRVALWVSLPGLVYSIYWLLQPDEIMWSLKVGFSMYPRAFGLVSNPITNAEGLTILACWSLVRLGTAKKLERRLIMTHLIFTVLIVTFSRVRAGIIALAVVFIINGILTPRIRKISLFVLTLLIAGFAVGLAIFGFNRESILERIELQRNSLILFQKYPILGIGPNKFDEYTIPGSDLTAHSHNTVLGISTEMGTIGLIAFLCFMFIIGRRAFRLQHAYRKQNDHPLRFPALALFTVYLCFWIYGFFDYNFSDTELLIFHGYHWALIARVPLPDDPIPTDDG